VNQPDASARQAGTLRIATANLEEGGVDPDGATDRWARSVAAIAAWEPDVVCVQEMAARRDPHRLRRHLWATAHALAMIPVLGPEGGNSGNHTAILVRPQTVVITDEGPPPGTPDPAWCEALLRITAAQADLRVYSVHLPPARPRTSAGTPSSSPAGPPSAANSPSRPGTGTAGHRPTRSLPRPWPACRCTCGRPACTWTSAGS
jgi:hypothetical protein